METISTKPLSPEMGTSIWISLLGDDEPIVYKTLFTDELPESPNHIIEGSASWAHRAVIFEKLSPERYLNLLEQTADGPNGGINKIIFAGYATDPFNYEYIDGLVEKSINLNQIIGVHTKLIKVSDKMLNLLTSRKNKDDYINKFRCWR